MAYTCEENLERIANALVNADGTSKLDDIKTLLKASDNKSVTEKIQDVKQSLTGQR